MLFGLHMQPSSKLTLTSRQGSTYSYKEAHRFKMHRNLCSIQWMDFRSFFCNRYGNKCFYGPCLPAYDTEVFHAACPPTTLLPDISSHASRPSHLGVPVKCNSQGPSCSFLGFSVCTIHLNLCRTSTIAVTTVHVHSSHGNNNKRHVSLERTHPILAQHGKKPLED